MKQFLPSTLPSSQVGNCWRTIGIRGDKSCAALEQFAHCRNCPTYARIATSLLARKAEEGASADWNDAYAAPRENADRKDRSVLILRVGREWFAIPTKALDEVLGPRPVHRLPHRSNPVLQGVTNVRGELVVCVSLGQLLGLSGAVNDATKSGRLLVLRSASGRFAVSVDEVQETHRYQAADLLPPPATSEYSASSYTSGLLACRDRIVSFLDEEAVVKSLEGCLG